MEALKTDSLMPSSNSDDNNGDELLHLPIAGHKDPAAKLLKLQQSREDFEAVLYHDLALPGRAIIGAIQLLLDGALGPMQAEQTALLHAILDSHRAMHDRVNKLIDVHKYEAETKQRQIQTHDVRQIVTDAVKRIQPAAQLRSISVQTKFEATKIDCDATDLAWVLESLLDNALKFTQPGGRVDIETRQSPHSVLITVRDTGKGISEDEMGRLFQRFWSPHLSGRTYASTGLSLYMCRQIVELNGGRIWCESRLGDGSTIHIEQPTSFLGR